MSTHEEEPAPGPEAAVGLAGVRRGAGEAEITAAVRDAAESATDFSWLSRGDSVFIKPASNSGNRYPATTSPLALKAMVRLLKEKGAGRVVVGDMAGILFVKLSPGGMRGSTRRLMRSNGLLRAAEEGGAELHFFEEGGWDAFFEDGPASGDGWKSGIMMPGILRDVDHVVLLPRCSRHGLAAATLGMKAAVGYWRTDSRLEYHRDAATFHEKTAEANTVPVLVEKQRLVLTVADRVLATIGPDTGYPVRPETGLVFASQSLVAHDMVSLAWLLEVRKTVPKAFRRSPLDAPDSRLVVELGNRFTVGLLGGAAEAARAERLLVNRLETIWDHRALRRAFQVFGGVPPVRLIEANSGVPAELKRELASMTAVPVGAEKGTT